MRCLPASQSPAASAAWAAGLRELTGAAVCSGTTFRTSGPNPDGARSPADFTTTRVFVASASGSRSTVAPGATAASPISNANPALPPSAVLCAIASSGLPFLS